MTNAQILLAVILMQHALFGLLWLCAARWRLSQQPSLHWAAMALLVAFGMGLLLQRGQVPQWLSVGLGNLLMLASMLMLRRGVERFCRRRPPDREQALLLLLGGAAAVASSWPGLPPLPGVLSSVAIMVWSLLRAAGVVRSSLATEFGARTARWCAAPLALLAGLFCLRAAIALVFPDNFARYLQQPGGGAIVPAFVALFFSLVLQINLMALVVLRLVRRLQHKSDHDVLTGLLGRRAMQRLLRDESRRQRRHGGSFALLSIDIDHFKAVNDTHGHEAGDAVLARVAHTLRASAREADSVARMGGEEFCMLLPGTDEAGADQLAARLLATVRGLQHPEAGGRRGVSISIGVAVATVPGEALPLLQRRLDQALYAAKAAGRDRHRHAQPPAAQPAPSTAGERQASG